MTFVRGPIPVTFAAAVVLVILFQNCQPSFSPSLESNTNAPVSLSEEVKQALRSASVDGRAKFEMQRLQVEGVNAVSYWQDPIDPSLLWGRRLTYTGLPGEDRSREETWHHWNLVQYRLDFAALTIRYVRNVTSIGANQKVMTLGDGTPIASAYDPSVFIFAGQRYIAFECAPSLPGQVPGTCIGPVSENGILDTAKTVQVIRGARAPSQLSQSYIPSGSVPKVIVQNSRQGTQVILSWTVVRVTPEDPGRFAEKIESRAAIIRQTPQGIWRAAGAAGVLDAEDPSSVLIYRPDHANGTADIFGLSRVKGRLLAVSSVGNCVLPLAPVDGCYGLDVRLGESRWLSPQSINQMQPILTDLPRNPIQYFRIIRTPSGRVALLGDWLPPRRETPSDQQVSAGTAIVYHPVLDALERLVEVQPPPELEPQGFGFGQPDPIATPNPAATPLPVVSWRSLPPGRERVIQRNYQILLRRPASAAEVQAWAAEVESGRLACSGLQKGISLSNEYAGIRSGLSRERIIHELYNSVLERDPEPNGLSWHLSLFQSQDFGSVVNSIADSVEATSKCF